MVDPEVIRQIKKIVREEMAKVLKATVTANQDALTVSVRRFASDSGMPGLKKIQPYGLSSRAPAGTPTVILPVDNNPSHLNTVGEIDPNRPNQNDGETILYDAYGHIVYLSQSKMQFGSKGSANPMVLGDILQEFEDQVWNAILNASQIGWAAGGIPVFLDPGIRSTITTAKENLVDEASTNFLSQKCFTER